MVVSQPKYMDNNLGLGLGNRSGKKYIYLYKGKFEQRFKNPVSGSFTRVVEKGKNAGKEINVTHYDTFAGIITKVDIIDDKEYGKQFTVDFDVNGETYSITDGVRGAFSVAMLNSIENVKLGEPVYLGISRSTDDQGYESTSVFINQKNEKNELQLVKYAHTNSDKNGRPDKKLVKVNGKDTYDYTDQIEFFEKVLTDKIKPQLSGSFDDVARTTSEDLEPDNKEDTPF